MMHGTRRSAGLARRNWLWRAAGGLLGGCLPGVHWLWAQQDPPEKKDRKPGLRTNRSDVNRRLYTPEAERAVDAGLRFLMSRQQAKGNIGSGQYAENVAVSSLAGLAFLSHGSAPGEGKFGKCLDRLVEFVLGNVSQSGYVVDLKYTTHGPMYDHGFGTLFLAEVYGMTQRADIREKLKKAVQLIIRTQNAEGGWRYHPRRQETADISVTICQIMALRAARNAGIFVPKNVVDKTIEYVKKSQNADGGFKYMLMAQPSSFPRSAAGVVALYSAGVYEGREIEMGLEYLHQFAPHQATGRQSHYFYGHYYAVQAMYQAGDDHWEKWYPAIRDDLLSRARSDGGWPDHQICSEYATAMACIILQVPLNLLSIIQR